MEKVSMTLASVMIPEPPGGTGIIILVETNGKRTMTIYTGMYEVVALAALLKNSSFRHATTSETLVDVVRHFGGEIKEVVIYTSDDGVLFHANVTTNRGTASIRPSDALYLAYALHAPVFTTEETLARAKKSQDEQTKDAEQPQVPAPKKKKRKPKIESPQAKIERLSKEMTSAMEKEEYEKCATLRDTINRIKRESNLS